MADHDAATQEPIDQLGQQQDAGEDAAAAAAAATAAAGAAGQQQADMDALAAAAAGLNLGTPLTATEEEEVDSFCKLLEAAGQTMPRTMLVQSYCSNSTLMRSHVLSVAAKSLSIMGPQGSGKDSLFKDLSKQHTCGILYTGSKAKDNPHDIGSYLSSCGLWLSLKKVPEHLRFCYGYLKLLHSDARAKVFSQLKGCNHADLIIGSYTWDDFCQGVLGSALAGRKETDMQILYDCSSKRSDLKQPKTLQIVGELEVLWSRMQQQPDDVVNIWLHFQAKGGVNKPGNGFGKGKFKPKPPGPPTCYGCREKGHIRRDCPKEQKK
ncbi:hypothetical protein OEZ85_002221 [Tetradesmus obliquus]|uniref:CCHC-type domain-containing protein n=1 Tax=Tetradesmus obliquus TaxID=3088 RepID=A0ABY8U2B1_TETOB|nr:hypothetical protein OEZ85_002221 [Tetradesmus obliquus]